ncbi:hypothetical protein [Ureibacillus acetophenoni]|uniref:Uncharacterized protein n=1 Tax=Ureibacillus acetophenoni TaxID=614649 RepID=A0A285U550_9BACL|nr:hypothetical protein [Ureibacillus acetophenoni]SOC37074.1 hypothetical protein SAMN05877842_1035 [Ureibacillus acetophenoni]
MGYYKFSFMIDGDLYKQIVRNKNIDSDRKKHNLRALNSVKLIEEGKLPKISGREFLNELRNKNTND